MRPKLVHPTTAKIARLDRSSTEWDPVFRMPKGQVAYSEPVEVWAQVEYSRVNEFAMTPAGEMPFTMGHLTMTKGDFEKAGGFSEGDRIVEIGNLPVEAYIVEIRPAGHYFGKPELIVLMFESRRKGP
ncbi:MAG TPA: hypothetical protein GXX51_05710 [Firmicutes bacterium]|nr:hypothetical protein [Bacillota bacterium]